MPTTSEINTGYKPFVKRAKGRANKKALDSLGRFMWAINKTNSGLLALALIEHLEKDGLTICHSSS